MLSSVSCLVLLQGIFPVWRNISRHISATKWHGSLCCYIWNYEHPASKKPCPIVIYGDMGMPVVIYETAKKLRYLISFVLILLRFSLIFKGFQRLVSWLLHHFYTTSAFGFIGFHQTTPFC